MQTRYAGVDILSHDSGHLWHTLLGWKGNTHTDPLHLLSFAFIGGGFFLLASAWRVLYQAQSSHLLATTGAYAKVRHPQYDAFVLIMFGFLLQWPTILTLLMFPVLVWMYVRLARSEERDADASFGERWREYAARTPRFIPQRSRSD